MSKKIPIMVATAIPIAPVIPTEFIYEIIDGKEIYYRGYKEAIANNQSSEEIMGCSSLQAELINYILEVIHRYYDHKKYRVHTNESGLQLGYKDTLAGDIVIYDKQVFTSNLLSVKYSNIAPKYIIEVDTNADLSELNFMSYVKLKAEKLFEFGVEKIFWVFTPFQKVLLAQPQEDWKLIDWNKDIELFDTITFNIGNYIAEEGIQI